MRAGAPKVDLAIYHHSYEETIDFCGAEKLYKDDGLLEQSGYTYDFVSPSFFQLEEVTLCDHVLCKKGPAYRALIFDHQKDLPCKTAEILCQYALAGFPLVFVGEYPSQAAFHLEGDVSFWMDQLAPLPNVRLVKDTSMVKEALEELSVYPRVRYQRREKMLNLCRHTPDADFFYFYNYGGADDFYEAEEMDPVYTEVTLEGTGRPWLMDAWTGKKIPLASYTLSDHGVTVPVKLEANDSCILVLEKQEEEPVHLPSSLRETEYAASLLNALLDYGKRNPYYDWEGKTDQRQPESYGILGDVLLIPYTWEKV